MLVSHRSDQFHAEVTSDSSGDCGTWQLDTSSSSSPSINQTGISCQEERKPLCLRPVDPDQPIEEIQEEPPASKRNKGRGRRRKKFVNKKRHSLRWRQRKNKKSEKIGFVRRRQGRSVSQGRQNGCDPVEVGHCKLH